MESIGQKLTSARESLGFSIEQIARETNIAKSYLTALEGEDFDSFPGETYLLGFLRTYSEYIGLVPEDMINLYRNMKIQEQPAPIEELLDNRSSRPKNLLVFIVVAAVLALGAAGYFYIYPNFIEGRSAEPAEVPAPEKEEKVSAGKINIRNTYDFADEVLEKRFNRHDAVSVLLKDESYQILIAEIADGVTFLYPQGEIVMKEGGEVLLDLNGDSSSDIRMLLRSFDANKGTLVLHLDRFVQSAVPSDSEITAVAAPAAAAAVQDTADTAATGRAGAPSRVVDTVVIRDAVAAEPFTLNIIFRGYCLLRYESDSSVREERYFHKGETFRLDVNSRVKLWASNAGALSGKVNGVDVNFGGSGEISTRTIKWIYNSESSKYELSLVPSY